LDSADPLPLVAGCREFLFKHAKLKSDSWRLWLRGWRQEAGTFWCDGCQPLHSLWLSLISRRLRSISLVGGGQCNGPLARP